MQAENICVIHWPLTLVSAYLCYLSYLMRNLSGTRYRYVFNHQKVSLTFTAKVSTKSVLHRTNLVFRMLPLHGPNMSLSEKRGVTIVTGESWEETRTKLSSSFVHDERKRRKDSPHRKKTFVPQQQWREHDKFQWWLVVLMKIPAAPLKNTTHTVYWCHEISTPPCENANGNLVTMAQGGCQNWWWFIMTYRPLKRMTTRLVVLI